MAAPFIQANTNGRLHAADEPSISPLNRGFLYGDAVYEVWRTYHGVLFAWDEHWARLERSARALHMHLPWSPDVIFGEIRRTVTAYRERAGNRDDLYVRLQVTRGGGAIGLDPALAEDPVFILLVQPVPRLPAHAMTTGLRLSVATELRRNPSQSLNPAWKTGNYLNNILCLREARARGADEVVITNIAGEITEAAVCNIVFVQAGRLVSPPLRAGILEGITRHMVATVVAREAGFDWEERPIRPTELGTFEECMLLATTKDVQPVGQIDEHHYRVGSDTHTTRLKAAFATYARRYADSRPELAV